MLSKSTNHRFLWLGSGFCIFGVLLALALTIVEMNLSETTVRWVQLLLHLGDKLAVAAISIGLVGIIMQVPEWTHYFEERLASIVVQQAYLKRLGKDELVALQTATLKAFYGVDEIDREGSFLGHFHSRIRELIASPFRTEMVARLAVAVAAEPRHFVVEERMTYRCKRVGRAIQKTIRYFPSEGEFVSIHMTSLRLIPPEGQQLPDKPFKTIDITKEPDGSILLDQDLLANQFHTAAGYEIPLDGFSDIENLGVDLQVSYTIRRDRFIGWGMSEPTKGFDLLVVTDNDIHVEYEVFGLASGDIDCDRGLHYLRLRSSSWIQPDAGIAIQLSAPHDRGCGPEQQGKPATEAVTDTKPAPPAKQEDPAN